MKVRQALRAVRPGFAVYDDPGEREGHDGRGDRDHFGGPVPAVAAPQPDLVAILQHDDPEAVVLQLVDPAVADRTFTDRTGWHGRMKPGGWRRSRARGERINMGAV